MEKIKVLRVITRMNIGGPAIQAVLLSAGLNKSRFSSILVTGQIGSNEGDMGYLAKESGIESLMISELRREPNIVNDIISFYKLYNFIKREKPDVVHTHTAKAGTIGRLAAKLAGTPLLVHTFHGHVFHSYFSSPKTGLFLLIERLLARVTDKIVTISDKQKDEIKRFLRLNNGNKLALIPLGFDLDRFIKADMGDEENKLRKELNIPEEAIVVGSVGRLTVIKNHRMFLEAAREIRRRSREKKVKFLIIGDGELKDELVALSNKLGIHKDVIFAGWRKDMALAYGAMNIVTLTSLNEGTPVSLIEALASAKAVAAVDVGGVRDVVESGKSGVVVPANDINAFCDAVLTLINDEKERTKLGLYGREFVQDRHSKERLINDIEGLYSTELRKKHLKS